MPQDEVFDDVPAADAAEQQRPLIEEVLDEEDSAVPPSAPDLEVPDADWQDQSQVVELDPDDGIPTD